MFSKSRASLALLAGAFVFTAFLTAFARVERKAATITATGCLQKGEVLNRFHLVGRDGKAYALRSSAVKLADHLGHSVTIKGELRHDSKRDDYDFEGSEVNEEYGKGKIADFVDVEVTSLKMNSASCPAGSGK